jgi:hypothetical protein
MTLCASGYMFGETVDGSGHWRPDSVSRGFRYLAEQVGTKGFTLYAIRHQVGPDHRPAPTCRR